MEREWSSTAPWMAALVWYLAGCGLIIPSDPDAGSATAAPEASLPPDASWSLEAGAALDANGGDAQVGCRADDQCEEHAYCTRGGACAPRCDAHDGCIGPTLAASNNRVVNDGRYLCYADDSADGAQYVIRAWDATEREPLTLARAHDAQVMLIADGHCYYFAEGEVQRAPLTGGRAERLRAHEGAPRRAFASKDAVWWLAPEGEGFALVRLARVDEAAPEPVASVPGDQIWEAGNGSHLFRRFSPSFGKCAIAMAPIADLADQTVIPMSFSKNCSAAMWADEETLVFPQYEPVRYYPFRLDLADPTTEHVIRLHSVELLMYQVRGEWVYGQSVIDGSSVPGVPNTVSYHRATLDGGPTERFFTPTPGTAQYRVQPYALLDAVYNTFAVLDGKLVYQHALEARWIVTNLPPEP